jgi:hypothetical protein
LSDKATRQNNEMGSEKANGAGADK